MEESQLKILEERINNAITFIENLKSKGKKLLEEKEEVQNRVVSLEKTIEEKDLKIEALKKNQLFLKDKIETILDKLESLAGLDAESSVGGTASFEGSIFEEQTLDEETFDQSGDSSISGDASEENDEEDEANKERDKPDSTGEIIIEENLVDLTNEKDRAPVDSGWEEETETESPEKDNSDSSDSEEENSLFESDD